MNQPPPFENGSSESEQTPPSADRRRFRWIDPGTEPGAMVCAATGAVLASPIVEAVHYALTIVIN